MLSKDSEIEVEGVICKEADGDPRLGEGTPNIKGLLGVDLMVGMLCSTSPNEPFSKQSCLERANRLLLDFPASLSGLLGSSMDPVRLRSVGVASPADWVRPKVLGGLSIAYEVVGVWRLITIFGSSTLWLMLPCLSPLEPEDWC